MVRLFTYGCLKDRGTHSLRRGMGCNLERKAWVFGWGMYYATDHSPTIAPEPTRVIHGEIWTIPEVMMEEIDLYHGPKFTSGIIDIPYGDRVLCYYYEYEDAVGLRPVERGFWPPPSN